MTTSDQLRTMRFDVVHRIMPHADGDVMFQITDSTGITLYMPDSATLEQCLARYQENLKQFEAVNKE